MKVAAAHPDVVVVQQGNVISGTVPPNAGTYFGTVYEPVFLAGIAAVGMKTSMKSIRQVGVTAIALIVAETVLLAVFVLGGLEILGHGGR